MSNSNRRIKEYDTVHHITSRIAHRVYFLEEDERNDMIEIVRRAAIFCGMRLLAWCIMTNHFHLMIHLPVPVVVDEGEILRRYAVLKGSTAGRMAETQLGEWRKTGECGMRQAEEWLNSQRRRMYDVGEFMKIVKQWFTEEYNRRHAHVGTLWEAAYHDRPVSMSVADMSFRMGYIHLNPMRAAADTAFDGYLWSSFSAFARGDEVAIAGMRFVYDDDESSLGELRKRHEFLLEELLENAKRRRAEEIARKRALGYEMPTDPLTDEARVVQAAAMLERMQLASEELNFSDLASAGRKERQTMAEKVVKGIVAQHPDFGWEAIVDATGMSRASVFRHIKALHARGEIERDGKRWLISA